MLWAGGLYHEINYIHVDADSWIEKAEILKQKLSLVELGCHATALISYVNITNTQRIDNFVKLAHYTWSP